MLESNINSLIKKKPFSIKKEIKYKIFLSILKKLTKHHEKKNIYFNQLASYFNKKSKIEFFPYLGTDIFKHKDLKSIKKKIYTKHYLHLEHQENNQKYSLIKLIVKDNRKFFKL